MYIPWGPLSGAQPTESSAEDKCNELEEAWNSCVETAEILKEEVAEVPIGAISSPQDFSQKLVTMISKKYLLFQGFIYSFWVKLPGRIFTPTQELLVV